MLNKITHIKLAVCIKAYSYIYTVHFCIFQLQLLMLKGKLTSNHIICSQQTKCMLKVIQTSTKIKSESNVRKLKDSNVTPTQVWS